MTEWWMHSKLEMAIRHEVPNFTSISEIKNLSMPEIEKVDAIIGTFLRVDPRLDIYYENPSEIEENFDAFNKILFEKFGIFIPRDRLLATGLQSNLLSANTDAYFALLSHGIINSDGYAPLIFMPVDTKNSDEEYANFHVWKGKITDELVEYIKEFVNIFEPKSEMRRYVAYFYNKNAEDGMYISVFYTNDQNAEGLGKILSQTIPEYAWIIVA